MIIGKKYLPPGAYPWNPSHIDKKILKKNIPNNLKNVFFERPNISKITIIVDVKKIPTPNEK